MPGEEREAMKKLQGEPARSWRVINEIEDALRAAGRPITAPLVDSVLELLAEASRLADTERERDGLMTLIYEVAQELHHTGDDAPAVTVGRLRNYNLMRYAAGNLREFIDYPSFKDRAEKAEREAAEAREQQNKQAELGAECLARARQAEAREARLREALERIAGMDQLKPSKMVEVARAALSNPPTSEEDCTCKWDSRCFEIMEPDPDCPYHATSECSTCGSKKPHMQIVPVGPKSAEVLRSEWPGKLCPDSYHTTSEEGTG